MTWNTFDEMKSVPTVQHTVACTEEVVIGNRRIPCEKLHESSELDHAASVPKATGTGFINLTWRTS